MQCHQTTVVDRCYEHMTNVKLEAFVRYRIRQREFSYCHCHVS